MFERKSQNGWKPKYNPPCQTVTEEVRYHLSAISTVPLVDSSQATILWKHADEGLMPGNIKTLTLARLTAPCQRIEKSRVDAVQIDRG